MTSEGEYLESVREDNEYAARMEDKKTNRFWAIIADVFDQWCTSNGGYSPDKARMQYIDAVIGNNNDFNIVDVRMSSNSKPNPVQDYVLNMIRVISGWNAVDNQGRQLLP
jgi:hypothetical protein